MTKPNEHHVDLASAGGDNVSPPVVPQRTYTVYCNHYIGRRRVDRDIARGLAWSPAKALSETLQARERVLHPLATSWTCRLFHCRLEK